MKSTKFNQPGQKYRDFEVVKVQELPELQCVLHELVHLPSGAQVMHLENKDPENLFCLSFRTLPDSSNGVAHILEHTVLCGSEKFPIKDPFFAMTRRSLNTFMNAFTGADFTCYPAASQVPKDFYNILSVYLDAVFKPNLDELSFLQEGHRYEFSTPNDSSTPLEHKGIVFNEMKGALLSGNARLSEALHKALLPDLPYGYNSGGDPKVIPQLTHEELRAFHQKYYHPSRCLFFFYGNMPLEGHLDFISEHALQGVNKAEQLPSLPLQPRFKKTHYVTQEYPISAEEDASDKTFVSFAWLTCHILQQDEVLALSVIDTILMDTDASPLKHALLKSGLCKQASAYIDTDMSEVPLVITLRGCNPEDAEPLEELLDETLRKIIREGIPLDAFEGAMHQIEFSRSEIGGNHAPFGLSLFFRSALVKQQGGKPERGLLIHTLFDQLRRKHLEDPHYLTGLIKKYLLNNSHKVRVVMVPSKNLASREAAEERAELDQLKEQLSAKQKREIIKKAKELIEYQKHQEESDVDVLPKISLDDVPQSTREYALSKEKVGKLEVFHHSCFTNEIAYADIIFDLPEIAKEDLPYLRLLTVLMPQMGWGGRSYVENLDYIQAHTGGISTFLAFNLQVADYRQFYPSIYLRGKALYRKVEKLFPLLRELAEGVDFRDTARLKEVVLKHYTSLQSSLNQQALKYAINLSASALHLPSKLANMWYGLEYYWMVKQLAENIDAELPNLIERLERLQQQVLCLENPQSVLTCDAEMYDELKRHQFYGLTDLETKPSRPWKVNYGLDFLESQGRVIASPVAFTSHVIQTVPYVHPDAPALNVAAGLFENLVLHSRIREQGGAYGGGATSNTLSGNFCFYAYRDPNISRTLTAFEEAVQEMVKGDFLESDLEEAKLEIIQGLDAPVAPGSRGDVAYSRIREGKTREVRQAYRNKLLSLTSKDVISAIQAHIEPRYESGVTVVFAGKELLEKENELLRAQHKKTLLIEYV